MNIIETVARSFYFVGILFFGLKITLKGYCFVFLRLMTYFIEQKSELQRKEILY